MPIYEFQCQSCQHQEEILQKVSDPAPECCPACGKNKAFQKVVSQTSFQLKGGGWYNEGYASSKPTCDKPGCGTDKAPCQAATAAPSSN